MLSSALAFATIVQLITIFKQETNSADIGEFKTWLEEHNFPKLRTLLGDDPETTRRVEAYLSDMDGRITGKLEKMHGVVEELVALLTGADSGGGQA